MIQVEDREAIRQAYFVEQKTIRQIARELGRSRVTIREALESAEAKTYTLQTPRSAPVLGPFKARIDALLAENARLPRKQRYTARQIYKRLQSDGFAGAEITVRRYIAGQKAHDRKREVFLPLEFDPGRDAQADWFGVEVVVAGQRVTAQVFNLRLNHSRRRFLRAYPAQKQECFFDGHVEAFAFLGGVPETITYDNLTLAVRKVLEGKNREEQRSFVAFRSHYLFQSRFCTPAEGHEKGGVESDVGFAKRNFFTPPPEAASWEALNTQLREQCEADGHRRVDRQPLTIEATWEQERPHLRAVPPYPFTCCRVAAVTLNAYSQVTFETNRYSVPAEHAYRQLVVKAYPFRVEVWHATDRLASHPRLYGHQQEVLDPLHYLPLLVQRPGAFEHAKPLRRWRETWPPAYEGLLQTLQEKRANGAVTREFLHILALHRQHPAELIERAIQLALQNQCAHLEGVRLFLHQLEHPEAPIPPLDLSQRPQLQRIQAGPVDLRQYEALLGEATHA